MKLTKNQLIRISNFLYNNYISHIIVNKKTYDIQSNTKGLRYITIDGTKYIQQNPEKNTEWGVAARAGKKVTWGIRDGKWALIIDSEVIRE